MDSFLYLAPNYDLLFFLVSCFATLRRPIYFGLAGDFLDKLFDMPLRSARPGAMITFAVNALLVLGAIIGPIVHHFRVH